ncbi:hypothetical protein CR513_10134, partial [Mucuna pruriens]
MESISLMVAKWNTLSQPQNPLCCLFSLDVEKAKLRTSQLIRSIPVQEKLSRLDQLLPGLGRLLSPATQKGKYDPNKANPTKALRVQLNCHVTPERSLQRTDNHQKGRIDSSESVILSGRLLWFSMRHKEPSRRPSARLKRWWNSNLNQYSSTLHSLTLTPKPIVVNGASDASLSIEE